MIQPRSEARLIRANEVQTKARGLRRGAEDRRAPAVRVGPVRQGVLLPAGVAPRVESKGAHFGEFKHFIHVLNVAGNVAAWRRWKEAALHQQGMAAVFRGWVGPGNQGGTRGRK